MFPNTPPTPSAGWGLSYFVLFCLICLICPICLILSYYTPCTFK
jgi:hypothetical protein